MIRANKFKRVKLSSLIFLMVIVSSSLISTSGIDYRSEPIMETISPADKIHKSLKPLVADPNMASEYAQMIVIFKWDWVDHTYLEGIEFSLIHEFDYISGIVIKTTIGSVKKISENVYVQSIWLDEPIKTPTQIDPSVLNMLKSAGVGSDGFVNFTKEIGADVLWEKGFNGSKTVIAVLDTGVDITGSIGGDLDDFDNDTNTFDMKFLGGVSLVPDEPLYYSDLNGRGTFHAGIACGTGDINRTFIGVAPGASFLNVKVFDVIGITYWSFIVSGIEWSITRNADIILFATTIPGMYFDPVCMAVDAAVDHGILVIAPVGDDGPSYMSINTPGQANKAFKVGAYDSRTGTVANFSSRGPSYDFQIGPHVIAPGVNLIGPASRIISPESGEMLQSLIQQISGLGIEIPLSFDNIPDLSELTATVQTFQYGESVPDQSNYTKASGTGAAAAVVAGACSILISAFPLATPELIKLALINTAISITPDNDQNSEGAGLINLPGAYDWLEEIFSSSERIQKDLISSPLFYPGFVSTNDMFNVSRFNFNDFGSDYVGYDITALMSTQAMMTALIVSNMSNPEMAMNFSSMHLPLNQFGLKYNTSENKTEFHWFSEFNVVRELSQSVSLNLYQEGYLRYTGVLEFNGIYISVIVESWAFTGEYNGTSLEIEIPNPILNITLPLDFYMFNATDNVNAIQMSFSVINFDSGFNLTNVELFSYFKADLFINEYGFDDPTMFLEATYDDVPYISDDLQTLYMTDTNSNDSYPYPDQKSASMGFKSTTHQSAGYIIDDSISLLLNLTLFNKNDSIWNTTRYVTGVSDPGFAMKWNLGDISLGQHVNYTGALSVGIGPNIDSAVNKMFKNFNTTENGVTNYNVTDVMVLDAEFSRTGAVLEKYPTSCKIMNIGNTIINQTSLAFIVNRTNEDGVIETSTMVFTVENLLPFEIREYRINYVPLFKGVYSIAWAIGDLTIVYADTNPLNNLLARNLIVIDGVYYDSIVKKTFGAFPNQLDQAPMTLFGSLDIGIYNISVCPIRPVKDVNVKIEGIGEKFVIIDKTHFDILNPYDSILAVFIGNPLVPPDIDLNFNITFTQGKDSKPFYKIPVKVVMKPTRGRILFDIAHLNFFVSDNIFGSIAISPYLKDDEIQIETNIDLDNLDLDFDNLNMTFDFDMDIDFSSMGSLDITKLFDLSARFDTIWGGYFDLKRVWSDSQSNRGKGASVMCIPPLISINTSLFLPDEFRLTELDLGAMVGETGFLGRTLGDFKFESDVITTSYITHDVLQFFDVLVLNKPKQALLQQEIINITSWVEKGGTLILLAEDRRNTNTNSVNQLLHNFDLELSNSSFTNETLEWGFSTDELQTSLARRMTGSITLDKPVSVNRKNGEFKDTVEIEFLANNSIAFGTKGRGKILVIGDANIFDNGGLQKTSNEQFAQECLRWALSNYYEVNMTQSSSIIKKYNQGTVMANITNSQLIDQYNLTDKGFLFVGAFFYEDGTVLNASLYGMEIPALPMFYTDGYQYNIFFDSTWYLEVGDFYILIIVDHPAASQELFYVKFTVVDAPPPDPVQKYDYPDPGYPHWIDIAGIMSILYLSLLIWYYDLEKYKSKLKVTQLKGDVLNQATTIINEAKSLLKIIIRNIEIEDIDEVEKIRSLLNQRGRLGKYFKNLKKFGTSIGEKYR